MCSIIGNGFCGCFQSLAMNLFWVMLNVNMNITKFSLSVAYFSRQASTCFCKASSLVRLRDFPGTDSFLGRAQQQTHTDFEVSESLKLTRTIRHLIPTRLMTNVFKRRNQSCTRRARNAPWPTLCKTSSRDLLKQKLTLRPSCHRHLQDALHILQLPAGSQWSVCTRKLPWSWGSQTQIFWTFRPGAWTGPPDQYRLETHCYVKVALAMSHWNHGPFSAESTSLLHPQDVHLHSDTALQPEIEVKARINIKVFTFSAHGLKSNSALKISQVTTKTASVSSKLRPTKDRKAVIPSRAESRPSSNSSCKIVWTNCGCDSNFRATAT